MRSSVFFSTGARIGPHPDGSLDMGQPSDVRCRIGGEPSDIAWLRSISQGTKVVTAVGDRCEIFMDGGIRRGTDVKALALGAKAVSVGRPVIWGLAHGGQDGVSDPLKFLNQELEQAMALRGCCRLEGIEPSMVAHKKSYFSKL